MFKNKQTDRINKNLDRFVLTLTVAMAQILYMYNPQTFVKDTVEGVAATSEGISACVIIKCSFSNKIVMVYNIITVL